MAEGLSCSVFNHFLGLLWGDNGLTYLVKANSRADSEWESFCNVITKMCQRPNATSQLLSDSVSHSSWEFLTQSNYSQQYLRSNYIAGTFPGLSSELQGSHSSNVDVVDTKNTEETFCLKFMRETLDSLHAVYETLKLDNLRKRSNFLTFIHSQGKLPLCSLFIAFLIQVHFDACRFCFYFRFFEVSVTLCMPVFMHNFSLNHLC